MNVAAENTNYKYFAGALQMRVFRFAFLGFFENLTAVPYI